MSAAIPTPPAEPDPTEATSAEPTPAERRSRRRRVLRWVVPVVVGVPLVAVLAVVTARVSVPAALALLGLGVVVTAVGAVLRAADRRRADALAPADPAVRANPPLDTERVRAMGRQGGHAAAVREVRRQAPWLSLTEAVELTERVG